MALTKLPKNAFGTGSVDDSKIEDGTIQNQEISGTIPADKLNSTQDLSSKTVTLPNTSVTNDMLSGSIANAKLSNSTITINDTSISLGGSSSVGVDVNWQSVQTTGFTAVAGNGYFVDTTSGAITVTLPASATLGDQIAIKDYAGTFASNNLTIGRNGHNIQGAANDSLISTNRASLVLVYVDSTKGWLYAEESNVASLEQLVAATGGTVTTSGDYKIHTFTGDGCFVVSSAGIVDYMVVAGGGGGGQRIAGGGGGGGYRESHSTPVSGCYSASPLATPTALPVSATTYPITVGAGGSGASGNPTGNSGGDGSNSIFSSITSTGGGGGGYYAGPSPTDDAGNPGGSGGGGGSRSGAGAAGGSGNTPPVSPPQGNDGGPGVVTVSGYGGAGGGGATAVGTASATTSSGGPGGAGATSSINGTPTARAGGGGGATCSNSGSGGTGGGGAGGSGPSTPGTAGTSNTGGGGGGGRNATDNGTTTGGSGGSGIVVIRYKFQ